MPPLFTIGIPTYNRSAMLRAALASASSQTWDDLEILVSDNASTDDTSEVVRQCTRPVRYLRNPANLGAPRNFAHLVEAARGEYFAFLQDDDLLHSDFGAKAIGALVESPKATLYVAYAALTPSTETFYFPDLFGPPFPLDWCAPAGRRVFDGRLVIPLSLWMSVAIPPAIAFRTDVLRSSLPYWDFDCPLYLERMILAEVASHGTVVADPWIAAIFRRHTEQCCQLIHRANQAEYPRQWTMLTQYLAKLVGRRAIQWEQPFRVLLSQIAEEHRLRWLNDALRWPRNGGLSSRAKNMVLESLPHVPAYLRSSGCVLLLKDWLRDLIPPLLHRWARRALGRSS